MAEYNEPAQYKVLCEEAYQGLADYEASIILLSHTSAFNVKA